MIFNWTKQFMIASAFFALLLTTVTTNLFVKEQKIVKEQLKDKKTFQVSNEMKAEQDKITFLTDSEG